MSDSDLLTTVSDNGTFAVLKELDLDGDYDVNEYINRSKHYKDFTEEELARISYKFNGNINKYTAPQLYKGNGRIYTKDLPRTIIEYFSSTKHNLDPNDYGYITKNRINLMEGFFAVNGINRKTHPVWCDTHEDYDEAVNIAISFLINDIAGGSLNGIYNPAAAALILGTISEYSNKIKIENMETFKMKEIPDISKLTTEELTALLEKPLLRQKMFKKQGYGDNEEDNINN